MFNKKYRIPGGDIYVPYETITEKSHVLIAGATGSGKSVVLNGIITTLLYSKSPYDCKFILIDPKKVELSQYRHLPHVLQYAAEKDDIFQALQAVNNEMENRYKYMERKGLREFTGTDIYIVIDEITDLMTMYKKDCFPLLQRLAALSRAAKMHIIACSQNVLCKTIPTELKCNFPIVIGLRTQNKQQSRLLIDSTGCELLPDPKATGTGYGYIRDGANLYLVKMHKYNDSEIANLVCYWTSKQCIA